jgi:hypothetical protein
MVLAAAEAEAPVRARWQRRRCRRRRVPRRKRRPPPPLMKQPLLRQLFHSCLTSGVTVGAAVLTATLHTTRNKPHHTKLTMEDTVYCRGPDF